MAKNIENTNFCVCVCGPSSGATSIRRKNRFKKFLAFTLAETLIVMGIIGIVSAITLPNLNSSTGEKEKVAKLKKIYQNLNDAVGRSAAVYGPIDEIAHNRDVETLIKIGDRMTEFMKVSKNCKNSTNQGCFANGKAVSTFRNIKNSSETSFDSVNNVYKFVLADGTSVAIVRQLASIWAICVNLDGPNKLPVLGKNTFFFYYNLENNNIKDEVVPEPEENCFDSGQCTGWVIQNGNLDYLKADKNGKCPNGKVLDYTTNTTCK